MNLTLSKSTLVLSIVIIVLTILASAGGLLINGLYRDNAFVTSTWLGNDIVTLAVAVPLLIVATILARRGSPRAYLVWLGLVESTLYNFGFYLFGSAFNKLFMVYAALFALSIWTLFIGLVNLDVTALSRKFGARTPAQAVSVYMLLVGLGLGTVYTVTWLNFVTSGQVPTLVVKTDQPTNVVLALDLSFVIPLFVVGAIWLWQHKPWGYVLATMVNVKGAVYMLGLSAATWTAYQAGTVPDPSEIGLWGSIGILCLIASIALLTSLKSGERQSEARA